MLGITPPPASRAGIPSSGYWTSWRGLSRCTSSPPTPLLFGRARSFKALSPTESVWWEAMGARLPRIRRAPPREIPVLPPDSLHPAQDSAGPPRQQGVMARFISGSGLKRVFGDGCPRHPVLVSRRRRGLPLNLFSQNWGGRIKGLGGDGRRGECSGTPQHPCH